MEFGSLERFFSILNCLNSTIVNMVEKSNSGLSMNELEKHLNTFPKQNVVDLFRRRKIERAKFGYKYILLSNKKRGANQSKD